MISPYEQPESLAEVSALRRAPGVHHETLPFCSVAAAARLLQPELQREATLSKLIANCSVTADLQLEVPRSVAPPTQLSIHLVFESSVCSHGQRQFFSPG